MKPMIVWRNFTDATNSTEQINGKIMQQKRSPETSFGVSETVFILIITFLVHLVQIPLCIYLRKRKKNLACMYMVMNTIMSLSHHCVLEVGLSKVFLEEEEFAKLEIVSGVIVLICLAVHLQFFKNKIRDQQINYCAMLIVLIFLETSYLNIWYESTAILLFFLVSIYIKWRDDIKPEMQYRPKNEMQNFLNENVLLFLGIFFVHLLGKIDVGESFYWHLLQNLAFTIFLTYLWSYKNAENISFLDIMKISYRENVLKNQ